MLDLEGVGEGSRKTEMGGSFWPACSADRDFVLIIKRVLEPVVLGPSVGLNPSSTCLKAFAISPSPFYSTDLYSILALFPCSSIRTFLVHSIHYAPFSSFPLFYVTGGGGSPTISRHKTRCLVQYIHLSLGEGAPSFIKLASAGWDKWCSPLEHVFFQKPLRPN